MGFLMKCGHPEFALFVCSDCPCCVAGTGEDVFHCEHDDVPADNAKEPLAVFDGVPNWCPIRKAPMLLVVGS